MTTNLDAATSADARVGRRICIYGPTGSGKTTLSRRLGDALGLPVVELDALFHRPGWQPTPDDEFRAKVRDAVARCPDGWVVEGNYREVQRVLLPLADTVIWLRPRFLLTYWRLVRRTVTRAWRREELWNGNRDSFRLSFLSRDSILLWGITNWRPHIRKMRELLDEVPHRARVLEVRGDGEAKLLLARVQVSSPA